MRLKQFDLKQAKADDGVKTEVVIFFFGAGKGGGAAENVARWRTMFDKTPEPTVKEETIAGAKATIVDLSGTYLHRARPMDPASAAEKRPDQRMLAVVLETPKGPYFIRLLGPRGTVTHHEKAFLSWLRAFKKKG
jgi:hypothetical protein